MFGGGFIDEQIIVSGMQTERFVITFMGKEQVFPVGEVTAVSGIRVSGKGGRDVLQSGYQVIISDQFVEKSFMGTICTKT